MPNRNVDQEDLVNAIISEIERQYGSRYRFELETGKDKTTMNKLYKGKTIGMPLFFNLLEKLDLDLVLVNNEGVNILG